MIKLHITVNQMKHYCYCNQTSQQHMGTQRNWIHRHFCYCQPNALIYQQLWFASCFISIISSCSALNSVAISLFTIRSSTVNRIRENICHSIVHQINYQFCHKTVSLGPPNNHIHIPIETFNGRFDLCVELNVMQNVCRWCTLLDSIGRRRTSTHNILIAFLFCTMNLKA